MKLIKKIDIFRDARLIPKPILKRQVTPSEQIMLFWFAAGRLSIID
jgi:hypothetical protein